MRPRLFFVELTVRDWAGSLVWYQDVLRLGVELRVEPDQFALLAAEGMRLALKGGTPAPGSVVLTWKVEDLDEWLTHLARCHIPLDGAVKGSAEGYRRVRFRDPDGYALCLFAWVGEP